MVSKSSGGGHNDLFRFLNGFESQMLLAKLPRAFILTAAAAGPALPRSASLCRAVLNNYDKSRVFLKPFRFGLPARRSCTYPIKSAEKKTLSPYNKPLSYLDTVFFRKTRPLGYVRHSLLTRKVTVRGYNGLPIFFPIFLPIFFPRR